MSSFEKADQPEIEAALRRQATPMHDGVYNEGATDNAKVSQGSDQLEGDALNQGSGAAASSEISEPVEASPITHLQSSHSLLLSERTILHGSTMHEQDTEEFDSLEVIRGLGLLGHQLVLRDPPELGWERIDGTE